MGSRAAQIAKAFELLDRGVQRQLWRMGWTELRPIQVEAIRVIMLSEADCVISSETASGKTEAAFLPILSKIADEPLGSVRAVYIGPLRALINDQFQRLEELCGYLDVPTHRWHGDVGASDKSRLVAKPGGVLLITPESVESLFVNRSHQLCTLFSGLRYVVIDELHSFLDNERGIHLHSLLCRLRRLLAGGVPFRVVGLSATIGDLGAAQRYVNWQRPDAVRLIQDEGAGRELKYRLHAYIDQPQPGDDASAEEREPGVMWQIAEDLVEHCRGSSNLVFANAKGDIELYADACNETARREGLSASFLVHHGSLSREIREGTETEMKAARPMTAICSSTLELGIDIGGVRTVGQIGAPWSVTSLKQRLGRSGRKEGEPRVMRVYIPCRMPGLDASLLERLRTELLQAIAITELLLRGWIEPSSLASCDLSTLTQQIISVIAETGGVTAAELYDRLVGHGAFRCIEPSLFKAVVRSLGGQDILEQTGTGELILGLEGERIRASRDFYAAFQTPAEFSVTTGERLIGTLPITVVPGEGDHLLLGGRRWKVVRLDYDRAEILVEPAKGRKRPLFSGSPGVLHERIREQMREVLRSDCEYVYLNSTASELLTGARRAAMQAHIFEKPVLSLNPNKVLWFTWTGTRTQLTLAAMLALAGVSVTDRQVALELSISEIAALAVIRRLAAVRMDPRRVAGAVQPKLRRKYDHFMTEELLDTALARDWIDVEGATGLCKHFLKAVGRHNGSR